MHDRSDKRRIYQLISMYLSGDINESTFSDEFYYSYDLELDHSTLNPKEKQAFLDLGEVAGRFSEFEEDINKHPGVYYTKEDLQKKIIETREKLNKYFDEIKNDGINF